MNRNKIIIGTISLILVGCAATPIDSTKVVIKYVDVPVPVPCNTPIPDEPEYNFPKLTTDASIFEKVKALLADRTLDKAYNLELTSALKSCK